MKKPHTYNWIDVFGTCRGGEVKAFTTGEARAQVKRELGLNKNRRLYHGVVVWRRHETSLRAA